MVWMKEIMIIVDSTQKVFAGVRQVIANTIPGTIGDRADVPLAEDLPPFPLWLA